MPATSATATGSTTRSRRCPPVAHPERQHRRHHRTRRVRLGGLRGQRAGVHQLPGRHVGLPAVRWHQPVGPADRWRGGSGHLGLPVHPRWRLAVADVGQVAADQHRATDLGLPTYEQGAGLLNSRAAVEAALTYPGATTAAPAGVSSNIDLSTSQINFAGAPGSTHTNTIKVTNVGTQQPDGRLGDPRLPDDQRADPHHHARRNRPTQTFPYPTTGAPWAYKKITFTVPAGTDRLVGQMIWQGAAQAGRLELTVTPVVRLVVFDPSGAFVTNSRPQGGSVSANYANLDIRKPAAGTYTAVLYTAGWRRRLHRFGQPADHLAAGRPGRAGQPGRVHPGAGRSRKNVQVHLHRAGRRRRHLLRGHGRQLRRSPDRRSRSSSAPWCRSRAARARFSGTITGGNARAGSAAQVFTYAFDVPAGKRDLSVGVKLSSDPNYQLEGVLVDPNDETQAIDSNALYRRRSGHAGCQGPEHAAERSQPGARSLAAVIIAGRQPGSGHGVRPVLHRHHRVQQGTRSPRPVCPTRRAPSCPAGSTVTAQVNGDQHRYRADQRAGRPADANAAEHAAGLSVRAAVLPAARARRADLPGAAGHHEAHRDGGLGRPGDRGAHPGSAGHRRGR